MKLNLVLNNYDVSFKSSQSLKHVIPYSFKELKHVSGVNCACCGNKLINPKIKVESTWGIDVGYLNILDDVYSKKLKGMAAIEYINEIIRKEKLVLFG